MKTRIGKLHGQSGTVLSMALIMMIVLASIAAAFMSTATASHSEGRQIREEMRAFYAAEGALIEAFAILRNQDQAAFDAVNYPLEIDGASYTVTATYGDQDPTLADDLVLLQATATDGTQSSTLSLLLRTSAGGQSLPWQVFSDNDITMNSNSYIDAYCSANGPWQRQKKKNWHGARYVSTDANVGTNGNVQLDSNSAVFGNANPGVGKKVSKASNSKVFGATTPLAEPIALDPAVVPKGMTQLGDLTLKDKKQTIGPGTFLYDDFMLDGNTDVTVIGPTTFYLTGKFEMLSNSVIETKSGLPEDFTIYMVSPNKTVVMDSNSDMIGNIYAPECDMEMNSNSEVTGFVVCDDLHMDSNSAIHVDTCLGGGSNGGTTVNYEVVSWVMSSEKPK